MLPCNRQLRLALLCVTVSTSSAQRLHLSVCPSVTSAHPLCMAVSDWSLHNSPARLVDTISSVYAHQCLWREL